MEEDDPFGRIIKRCQLVSSREDILRSRPFARESEVFPDGDEESPSLKLFEIPVDATGIVMVSLPESSTSKHESPPEDSQTASEDFQTPPEDSLPSGSEEQRPPADAVDTRKGSDETLVVDEGLTDAGRAVDLGKDSDNLGFSEGNATLVIDGGGGGVLDAHNSRGVDAVVALEVFESKLEEFIVLKRKSSLVCDDISFEHAPKKPKVSDKISGGFEPPRDRSGDDAPMSMGTKGNENANTEVIDLDVEEIGEGLGEDKVYADLSLKKTQAGLAAREGDDVRKNGNGGLARKHIEDLDKFKFVGSSGINRSQKGTVNVGGRRELPFSISGHAKNRGGDAGLEASAAKNQLLKDLLAALKMVAGELDDGPGEDVDFLETAKKKGMTFPRPRWWPPEDNDDFPAA
ncbi:hypothetical protein U1Q18_034506 [Sarracenia purpurea var. burkii]